MKEKIELILKKIGYDLVDQGKLWRTKALYRDGDNNTSLVIWKDTGTWKDFARNTPFMPFGKLLELSCPENLNYKSLLKDLRNNETLDFERRSFKKMEIDQFFDHDEVDSLLPHYSFYNDKRISSAVLREYRSGFSMSGKMNGRYVFPIIDQHDRVIGVTGRHLLWSEGKTFPKWKHVGRKTSWIYPCFLKRSDGSLFNESIEKSREIILVESVGDSLALSEQGRYDHMVVFGLELSSAQISHILSLNIDKIIISTNNDKHKKDNTGLLAAVKIFFKLCSFFDISKIEIRLPSNNDFGEMLKSGVDLKTWRDRFINRKKQIDFILDLNKKNEIEKNVKKIKLLEDYRDSLDD